MSDQPLGRPGNTGAGDNYDPDVHDPDFGSDSADAASAPSGPADGSSGQGDFDEDVRASEIDDITSSMHRAVPDGDDPDASANADGSPEIEIDLSDVDVLALLEERNEFKSIAQRIQADFDNFRKQSASRALADSDRATGRLAEALLPVLDAAEAAYLRHPDEVGPLLNQMLVELKKHGLDTIDLDGQPFDPEVAEAVAHEPGSGGEPVVAEVLRSGYRWKGKTLRAAMVKTTD
ncbi:MAG: nucleotide exchange factor GrpE [Ilumatobacter sp.]|jgi:molecular chaperone GrpE|uniref:nucleotide exchange factor GrpE n=1 Tax=Ilumatobacter sp. TaxID=1967498 RepID=UPI003919E82A